MDLENADDGERVLTREQATNAVHELGWRLVLGELRTTVPVPLAEAGSVLATAIGACGEDAAAHLVADVRAGHVQLSLQRRAVGRVTVRDAALAAAVTSALRGSGRPPSPRPAEADRPVQLIEIGIDALDIPAVRPFWLAVLGYVTHPAEQGHDDAAIADPHGQGPAVWFQQMDSPRLQRNRIHFDVSVPHDEAAARIEAAVAAGGRLLTAEHAPAFWVLADPEGNEACVTTWQGRD